MKFGDLLKGADKDGKEKHVPHIEVSDCGSCGDCGGVNVTVVVGKEVAHPNTVEHHIAWIQLFGVKENGQLVHLMTNDIGPVTASPSAGICINTEGLKSLVALEYCNIHGVWENSVDL